MTFGWRNACQTFQRLLRNVLNYLDFVFVHIDDIHVASSDLIEHKLHLSTVFQRLSNRNLTTNASKFQLGQSDVHLPGHKIDEKGLLSLIFRTPKLQVYLNDS